MRKPRKLKKAIKNSIVIYDIPATPAGFEIDELLKVFRDNGVLFYDSSLGKCPEFVNRVGGRVKIIDKK